MKKKYPSQTKTHYQLTHIGPMTVMLFCKMRRRMANLTDFQRVECLYNLLVLMNQMSGEE